MRTFNLVSVLSDPKSRKCICRVFITAALACIVFFIGSGFMATDYNVLWKWQMVGTMNNTQSNSCKNRCRPLGSEVLPEGIVARTSNLEVRPLWGSVVDIKKVKPSMNLLAIAVGIKQKQIVNRIVKKFPLSDFVILLFHYDGIVDQWMDLEWCGDALHVSAKNQTKWWFAKRFLHPDIVAEYNYIFLWDEDLEVENFHPERYLSIVKDEGLEISQPALDPAKSEVHHQITARRRKSKVHRRIYKLKGHGRCDDKSTGPPCIGWVEMMAPVFSRAAWRCAWYMIQNDLIHAWGLDMQLGYCAQGDRMKNVGVVDSEYIIHLGLPTLGVSDVNNSNHVAPDHSSATNNYSNLEAPGFNSHLVNNRPAVRRQSFIEFEIFKKRWKKAAREDECWIDPYRQQRN